MSVLDDYGTLIKKEQSRGNIIFNTIDDFIIERDKARVSQAVSNLLNNAIKFTKEGSIMVSAERISDDNNNNGQHFCKRYWSWYRSRNITKTSYIFLDFANGELTFIITGRNHNPMDQSDLRRI